MKMMSILKLNKISLAALLLASMALVMLPACSTTEEAPPPDSGGDTSTYDECIAACESGDLDCRELCVINAPI